jgi:hypothetical protein
MKKMAMRENRRVRPVLLAEAFNVYTALLQMGGYAPADPTCVVEEVAALADLLDEAGTKHKHATDAATVTRNALVAAEWAFHNRIMAVKNQIRAQYGVNSDQMQMIGLKRTSARKRPARGAKRANGSAPNGASGGSEE